MTINREVDMSPLAVAARLDEVRELYRLTMYLGRAVQVQVQSLDDPAPRKAKRE